MKDWWQEAELNRRHKDFQSSALPTELSCQPGAHIELCFALHGKTEFNRNYSLTKPPAVNSQSRPRMRGVICLFQTLGRQMRVDLRRDQVRVAQQLLHAAQVRPGVEQVRRIAVAEFVGRQ